jgi:hypothetical protein
MVEVNLVYASFVQDAGDFGTNMYALHSLGA